MALAKCKECEKEVSTQAAACPHCGAPAPGLTNEQIDNAVKQSSFSKSRWIGGVAFFGGLLWLFLAAQIGGADSFSRAWPLAIWLIVGGVTWYIVAEIERNLHERKQKRAARINKSVA